MLPFLTREDDLKSAHLFLLKLFIFQVPSSNSLYLFSSRAIFSVLDLMKVDMANFSVSSIRPHLMQQSVEYERKKFQELLEKQPNSLDFATQWLEEAADDLMNQKYKNALPAGGGASGSDEGPVPNPVAVQNHAYLRLLRWDHLQRPFPEVGAPEQSHCICSLLFVLLTFKK